MPATEPLRICVYCGSRSGNRPEYAHLASKLGRLIGERGWELLYGGGRVGLMGTLADAALHTGGTVIGVIPQSLMDREAGHRGLTQLHVVQTMHQRKQLMAASADAFIALPGGIGTFEELFEMWSWRHLGYHNKPIGLLDVAGYYDGLMSFIDSAVEQGFINTEQRAQIVRSSDPSTLLEALAEQIKTPGAPNDYSRI